MAITRKKTTTKTKPKAAVSKKAKKPAAAAKRKVAAAKAAPKKAAAKRKPSVKAASAPKRRTKTSLRKIAANVESTQAAPLKRSRGRPRKVVEVEMA